MVSKLLTLGVFTGIAVTVFALDQYLATYELQQVTYAATMVAVLYGIFRVGIEEVIVRRTSDARLRYTMRKAVSLIFIVLAVGVLLRIFVPNPEALLVAYGLLGAGVAIALQDLFKNFAGSIALFIGSSFRVGDRVEINGTYGDVIDIGLFYTTLLEIRAWVDGDQATGRILSVPNGAILYGVVKNYTKHYPFLWDELRVVVTAESDWRAAMHILGVSAHERTAATIESGRDSLHRMRRQFYIDARSLDPVVYMAPHDHGIALTVRYVVDAMERRAVQSQLWEVITTAFAEHPQIALAPPGFASVPYPAVRPSE